MDINFEEEILKEARSRNEEWEDDTDVPLRCVEVLCEKTVVRFAKPKGAVCN